MCPCLSKWFKSKTNEDLGNVLEHKYIDVLCAAILFFFQIGYSPYPSSRSNYEFQGNCCYFPPQAVQSLVGQSHPAEGNSARGLKDVEYRHNHTQ